MILNLPRNDKPGIDMASPAAATKRNADQVNSIAIHCRRNRNRRTYPSSLETTAPLFNWTRHMMPYSIETAVSAPFLLRAGHGHRGKHLRAPDSGDGEPWRLLGGFQSRQGHGEAGGAAQAQVLFFYIFCIYIIYAYVIFIFIFIFMFTFIFVIIFILYV